MGGASVPVLLYPDTVKVEVGLDTGKVVAFDQRPYLTTHDSPARVIPSPLISREEARAVLKPDLKVLEESPRLTVIPLLPTTEALAWEFRVQQGSDTYLVYVNAMTGKEDVVLRLIEDDTGAMAV
jgi:germination protein YpeB